MNMYLKIKLRTLTEESKVIKNIQNNMVKGLQRGLRKVHKEEIKYLGPLSLGASRNEDLTEEQRVKLREFRLEKRRLKGRMAQIHIAEPWAYLQDHRRSVIGYEARHCYLAYAFLRGTPYLQVEEKCYNNPGWAFVEQIVKKYTLGTDVDQRVRDQKLEEWIQDAKNHIKNCRESGEGKPTIQ